MKKRILSLFIVLAMIATVVMPITAFAASLKWTITGTRTSEGYYCIGHEYTIKTNVSGAKYYSSNTKIAEIDSSSGKLTLKKPGTVTITAKANKEYTKEITVVKQRATSVSCEDLCFTKPGSEKVLSRLIVFEPSVVSDVVKYISSDESVATVNEYGSVYARGYGDCYITMIVKADATVPDDDESNLIATAKVHVGVHPPQYVASSQYVEADIEDIGKYVYVEVRDDVVPLDEEDVFNYTSSDEAVAKVHLAKGFYSTISDPATNLVNDPTSQGKPVAPKYSGDIILEICGAGSCTITAIVDRYVPDEGTAAYDPSAPAPTKKYDHYADNAVTPITVDVTGASAEEITLSDNSLNFTEIFETKTLTATLMPPETTDIVRFFSTDETVAKVDEITGEITALKRGNCKIVAVAKKNRNVPNDSPENLFAYADVTVDVAEGYAGVMFNPNKEMISGDTSSLSQTMQTVLVGGKLTKPDHLPKEIGDYSLSGWFTEPECVHMWDFDKDVVTSSMTLYAGWGTPCSVTYVFEDEPIYNAENNPDVLANSVWIPLLYFNGLLYNEDRTPFDRAWENGSMAECSNKVDKNSLVQSYNTYSKVIIPVYFKEVDTITKYISVGGVYDPDIQKSTKLYQTYYVVGWYTDVERKHEFDVENDVITGDTTLYAKLALKCNVTFDYCGYGENYTITAPRGSKLTEPETPTAEGYTFGGWYSKSGMWDFERSEVKYQDTVLYARWIPNEQDDTVECDGKTFDKAWNCTYALPTESGAYYLTCDVELRSQWDIPENSDISLCLNDHSVTYIGNRDYPAPFEGFAEAGYSSANNGNAPFRHLPYNDSGATNCDTIHINSNASLSIYDNGKTEHKFELSQNKEMHNFELNDQATDNYETVTGGYIKYDRWTLDPVNCVVLEPNSNFTLNGGTIIGYFSADIIVSRKNVISGKDASFVMNGGAILGYDSTYAQDAMLNLDGGSFTMNGGRLAQNYTNNILSSSNTNVVVNGGTAEGTFKVTFNKNGGTGGTDSVKATFNSDMPEAEMPEREGYTFIGYFDAETGGNKYYNADGTSAKICDCLGEKTLYAHWTNLETEDMETVFESSPTLTNEEKQTVFDEIMDTSASVLQNNAAEVEGVEKLVTKLKNVEATKNDSKVATKKIVFYVTPVDKDGNAVHNPESPITFNLPVTKDIAQISGYAKITHIGTDNQEEFIVPIDVEKLSVSVTLNTFSTVEIEPIENMLELTVDKMNFSVTAKGMDAGSGVVIVALYDSENENRLLDVKTFDLTKTDELKGEFTQSGYAKAMWWSDIDTMTPLCGADDGKVTE